MREDNLNRAQFFITWEKAQKLIPFFVYAREKAPMREEKEAAARILTELRSVRDMDYSPLGGKQVLLSFKDGEFFRDVEELYEKRKS